MTDNLFNSETTAKLEDLVGEGKKYADNDAAAKAIVEKDAFIARLLEEARRKEADLQAAINTKAFEDRMSALEQAQLTERREPPQREVTAPTPVDIEDVVQKAINDREQANNRTRNLMAVKDKLTEVYGPDYSQRVKARAQELNITLDKLNQMAAETPSAFYALIGLEARRQSGDGAPPATQQNSAAFRPDTARKGNAYYTNLRKTNPAEYWTPRVQMEEYNELKRQGPDQFYT